MVLARRGVGSPKGRLACDPPPHDSIQEDARLTVPPFRNEPTLDYSVPSNLREFEESLARVRAELGRDYPLVLGRDRVDTGEVIESYNPAHPSQVVGRHASGRAEDVERAVAAGWSAFPEWSRTPMEERANLLLRAAAAISLL